MPKIEHTLKLGYCKNRELRPQDMAYYIVAGGLLSVVEPFNDGGYAKNRTYLEARVLQEQRAPATRYGVLYSGWRTFICS